MTIRLRCISSLTVKRLVRLNNGFRNKWTDDLVENRTFELVVSNATQKIHPEAVCSDKGYLPQKYKTSHNKT